MTDLTTDIADRLKRFTLEELIALICDFLADLGEDQQANFLKRVAQGPRPLVAEAMELDDAQDLLDAIQSLRNAIANDVYVEYGAGYDPEYGEYRGFGDDSWIDEMDNLFAAAASLFRAGQFKAAADAYIALLDIFTLSEDGFHFTRPDPVGALRTDMDAVKENLFIAIGRSDPQPAARAIEVSTEYHHYGANRYALLDTWKGCEEWMAALESTLVVYASQPVSQKVAWASHSAELLRELYRRYRNLPGYETLCRAVGPQQGWPYEDLIHRYREQENWEQALVWAEDGLEKLPDDSCYRSFLRETRGEALLHLDQPAEALDTLLALFRERSWEVSIYLKLRQAAQAVGRWSALYSQLTADMESHVLAVRGQVSYPVVILTEACLLGYAYLLEGDWEQAIKWAMTPGVPTGWRDDNLVHTVMVGLLRMGLAARGESGDEVLAQALSDTPRLIREYGDLLDPVSRSLPADGLLDSSVQLHERLIERAIGGKHRDSYAVAGALCKVVRSIRKMQAHEADFERYYQRLLTTYSRYSALRDELRKALGDTGRFKK